jgi:hypothetical protein
VPDHGTYTAVLPMRRSTVEFLAGERRQRHARDKRRTLSCWDQAVLVNRPRFDAVPF